MSSTLILLGGTGGLGLEMASGLVTAEGYDTKIAMVRDMASDKAQTLQSLGWSLVQIKDALDVTELSAAFAATGATKVVIVSTYGGNSVGDLEKAALQAAKNTPSVVLYVPSNYASDLSRWNPNNIHPFLAGKVAINDYARNELGIPILIVNVGYYSDTTFFIFTDMDKKTARIVGDGSALTTFTRRRDIGTILAKALADPTYFTTGTGGGTLNIAGETLSMKDAFGTFQQVTGITLEIEYLDPTVALEQEQTLLTSGMSTGDLGALFGSFVLHLLGEPMRGTMGSNTRAEANHYGVTNLSTLKETLQDVFGSGGK